MIGQTFLQYKILEKLGEGGMGVVYKAQDTKLDRAVALKFLPVHLNATEQDKARFLQEAKAAAALNHPNICSVMDVQEQDGQMFIVMEFVEGQTLKEKMRGMTQKQAIETGMQIADGLAAAHEKGIVHRDIKPENIMVRKDGIVQIMDFGLAKLQGVSRLTKEGSTVGTAGYMSPEQVQGHDVDHRSDIFSLGVLLYEMLTGELPFRGVHETAMQYEIVNVEATPMSAVKPEIPADLDAIVLECLAKEPDERYQSAKEVAKDLRRFKRESSKQRVSRVSRVAPIEHVRVGGSSSDGTAQRAPVRSLQIPWIVAGGSLVIAVAVLLLHFLWKPSSDQPVIRFTIGTPEHSAFAGQACKVSPDGQSFAFVARDSSGRSLLWVRSLSSLVPLALAGTDEATFPFWSPDGRFIAFFAGGKLKKIDRTGGSVQTICDAEDGRGGSWGKEGIIVFAPSYASGLHQVLATGGTAAPVTWIDTTGKEDSHRWPFFLPDGRRFVYLRRGASENAGIYLGFLDGQQSKLLVRLKTNAEFVPPDHLLYLRDRTLVAQTLDAGKGVLLDDAVGIAENVGGDVGYNFGFFSASMNGTLAYSSGGGISFRQFAWYDRTGKRLSTVGGAGFNFDFALSPDEKRLAFRRVDAETGNHDLWILDLIRQTESRFTFRPTLDDDPVWSPDGEYVIFDSNPAGIPNIFRKRASGAGTEEVLLKADTAAFPYDWSVDGRFILYSKPSPKGNPDIWVLPLGGDRKPFAYVSTDASENDAKFSPNVRWVAYSSNESGKDEVYVQSFPQTGAKWQVSTGGGASPEWRSDGKELFYVSPSKKLMSVDVTTSGPNFEQGIPRTLFDVDVDVYNAPNRYAVSKDGKRFLVNWAAEGSRRYPITVVVNWTAELGKR
jgi:eukaryotic-like serine/threonine-protein kinase